MISKAYIRGERLVLAYVCKNVCMYNVWASYQGEFLGDMWHVDMKAI